ncbi:TPA: peptidoglycan editing factor PgeF [Campylobacter fetus subsp. venerealis]|nr:peptidoglycan editing factor PgeF [Campylobacter fetus subsp. venerealis]
MLVCIDGNDVLAGFSTKDGGVSSGIYESLNLATHVGDDIKNVFENREILKQKIGAKKLIFMDQIHSDIVCEISSIDDEISPCDAIITKLKNVALCTITADCSPVLVYDKFTKKIAAIHAGRAGVVSHIVSKTIKKMGSKSLNLKVIIGANISGNCYDIGDLDLGEFNKFKNKTKFDMNAALKYELDSLGVRDYEFSGICTHCDERFFSYRKDGVTGRFCGFIMLKDGLP